MRRPGGLLAGQQVTGSTCEVDHEEHAQEEHLIEKVTDAVHGARIPPDRSPQHEEYPKADVADGERAHGINFAEPVTLVSRVRSRI